MVPESSLHIENILSLSTVHSVLLVGVMPSKGLSEGKGGLEEYGWLLSLILS